MLIFIILAYMKGTTLSLIILFFSLRCFAQSDSTGEDSSYFNLIAQVGNFAEDQKVYYDDENIYNFYKRGHDNNYTYYYFRNGTSSDTNEPNEICFKSSLAFNQKEQNISQRKSIKTPIVPQHKCSKTDSLLISKYLQNKKIIQSTYLDNDNFICLTQDTTTFLGYFIWCYRPLNRILIYSVSEKDAPPEHITMQYILQYKKPPVIITNQCMLGQCTADFYTLWE